VVTTTAGIKGGNAYHVLRSDGVTETARLDGFTVTGGRANANHPHNQGGGLLNVNSSPTLSNLVFSGNQADHGGGMYNDGSSPQLEQVTFTGNGAKWMGGGMANNGSDPTLSDVSFVGNNGDWYGGGLYNSESNTVLNDVVFRANEGDNGGGMANVASNPLVSNATFYGNLGGSGGAMANLASDPTLVNVTIAGNEADYRGGGLLSWSNSTPTLVNCIVWGNVALSNPQMDNEAGSVPVVSYSDVQGGYPGTNNIDADPLFVDADNGDLRLGPDSPAIDAGNNARVTATADLDGRPRRLDVPAVVDTGHGTAPIVDMGAYEAGVETSEHSVYLPLVVSEVP
jgi:hypothetical protein